MSVEDQKYASCPRCGTSHVCTDPRCARTSLHWSGATEDPPCNSLIRFCPVENEMCVCGHTRREHDALADKPCFSAQTCECAAFRKAT